MTPQSPLLVCAVLLSYTISMALGSGVLTIRLTGFKNTFGRTYDGTCCDSSPKDHGSMCYDQCDYVMRLIVTGLGRANDHVFLFHRPLTYDSNNIVFENGDSNLLLTVLFDEWPEDDQVKMNAFFYDYDDFDHTTTLVDWFETDLRHSANSTAGAATSWGNFQQQTVIGNRQADKTVLTFEWSALNEKDNSAHLTTGKNKVTVAPAAQPTHVTRLSTSREATDLLRQAWTSAEGKTRTPINIEEDLRTKVPGLLKSVLISLRHRKEQLPKRIMQNDKPLTNNLNYAQYKKESDDSDDEKLGSEHHFTKTLHSNHYPRRRAELMKRKPVNSSMSTSRSFHGKRIPQNTVRDVGRKSPMAKAIHEPERKSPMAESIHEVKRKYTMYEDVHKAERKVPMAEVIITSQNPKLLLQQRNKKLQPQAAVSDDSESRNADLDKPGHFKNRRPFVRPQSWFNSFSDKLSPVQQSEMRKKYGRKGTRKWKNPVDEGANNRRDIINQEIHDDGYSDVYFDRLAVKGDSYVGKEFDNGKSPAHSKTAKDKILNTPGRIAQHRPKSLIHRIHITGPKDLKLNLTEAFASKFGGSLQEPKIINSDLIKLDKPLISPRRKATKKRVSSANSVYKNKGTQLFVAQPNLQLEISPKSIRSSTATGLPSIFSKENQIKSSLDLQTQNNNEWLKSHWTDTKLQSGKLTTNVAYRTVDMGSVTSSTILTTNEPSKTSASNQIVVYKSNATTNNSMPKNAKTAYQNNKIKIKAHKFRKAGDNISVFPSFTNRPLKTGPIHLHINESRVVSAKNIAKNVTRKTRMWRKTTATKPDNSYIKLQNTRYRGTTSVHSLQKLNVSGPLAERPGVLHWPSNTTVETNSSLEQRQSTPYHHSKTHVPKPEPYAHTKKFINAAAAIDRPRFSPRKKGTQKISDYAFNEGLNLVNEPALIKQNVEVSKMKLKETVPTTPVFTWNKPKEIIAVGQSDAEINMRAPLDGHASYKPQSVLINSHEIPDGASVHIQNTDTIVQNEPTGNGQTFTKNRELNNKHMVNNKKVDKSTNDAAVDIHKFVPQIDDASRFASSELEDAIKSTTAPLQNSSMRTVKSIFQTEVTSNDDYVDDKVKSILTERHREDTKPTTHLYSLMDNVNDIGTERRTLNVEDKRLDTQYIQPAAKKYKINFTSLPELLEDQTILLPKMQVDQTEYNRGENEVVEIDNYDMELNLLERPNSHYKIKPKTPKPPTSGEVLYKSIKSLKAVKFQTHAPVQWYVTAQSILRNAAINEALPVKQSIEKVTYDNMAVTTNIGNVIDNKKINVIVLTNISVLDTKLHGAQKDLILNTDDKKKVFDDSSNGRSQMNEAFVQGVADDFHNKKPESKNIYTLSHSPNSITERINNRRTSPQTLDRQLNEYNNFSNNITNIRQSLKGSNKKSSLMNQDDPDRTDTESQYKMPLQPKGRSVDIQKNVQTSHIVRPSAFSVERKHDVMLKANTSAQFSNSANEVYQSKVDSLGRSLENTATVRPADIGKDVDKTHNTRRKTDNGQSQQGLERAFINNSALDNPTTTKSDFKRVPNTHNLSKNKTETLQLFTKSMKRKTGPKIGTKLSQEAVDRIHDKFSKSPTTSATNIDGFNGSKHEDKSIASSDFISQVNVKNNEGQSQLSVEQMQSNRDTTKKYSKPMLGKQTLADQESLREEISTMSSTNSSKKGSPETFQEQPSEDKFISSIKISEAENVRTSNEGFKPSELAFKQIKNIHTEKKPMKSNHVSATYNIKSASNVSTKATNIELSNPSTYKQDNKALDVQKKKMHTSLYVVDTKYKNTYSKSKRPDINKLSKLDDHVVATSKKEPVMMKDNISKYVPDKSENTKDSLLKTDPDKSMVSIVALQDVAPKHYIPVASVKGFTDTKLNKVIQGKQNGILYDDAGNTANGGNDHPLVSKTEGLLSVLHNTKLGKLASGAKNMADPLLNKRDRNIDHSNLNVVDKASTSVNEDRHVSDVNSNMILEKSPQIQATPKNSNFSNSVKISYTEGEVLSKTYTGKISEVDIPQPNSTKRSPVVDVRASAARVGVTNRKTQPPVFSKSPPGRITTENPTKVIVKTQLLATRNETSRDPFEMMSLFMAKQNLLEAILEVQQKQTTTVGNPAGKMFVKASASVSNSSSSLPVKTIPVTVAATTRTVAATTRTVPATTRTVAATTRTVPATTTRTVAATTRKVSATTRSSSSQSVPPSSWPPKGIPTRNFAIGKTSVNGTTVKAGINVKAFVEEKEKPKSTVEPETKRYGTRELTKTTNKSLSSVSPTSASTTSTHRFTSTDKSTRSAITKRLAERTNVTPVNTNTRVKPTQLSKISNSTQFSTFSPKRSSVPTNAKNVTAHTAGMQHPRDLKTTASLYKINNINHWEHTGNKLPVLGPNFDQNGTKILYSPGRPHTDEDPTPETLFTPVYFAPASMNTLPEHGFVLHTQSAKDSAVKSNKQQSDGLPLPKLSRSENGVRRHSIYREMNLDKFRSYVNAIRNYPTVKVPYHGLYSPGDQKNSAFNGMEVAELPTPGRRYGAFYSSVSNVGVVFTRYWPAVLGVSVGTIFLVTALVTSILCRQRRLLIQRTRWSDSPQHVSEPPDTSEYTSSSEASLASDLTRSSIHLM